MADRHIAVLVETSHASAREALRGILAFVAESGARWRLDHEPRRLENGPPPWLRRWRGDGIIARSHCPKAMAAVVAAAVPAVELLGVARHPSVPMVVCDERAAGRLAVDHLAACGLRSFAFVGAKGMYWSDNRREGFRVAVEAQGHGYAVFEFPQHERLAVPPEARLRRLAAWLRRLPHPVGIMAANDQYAGFTTAACRIAGIDVPDEAAVIGVDNDEVFCELASPPITSVIADHFTIGYEAAKLLAAFMDGRRPRRPPAGRGRLPADWVAMEVPPRGIVERHSTDFKSAPDADVAAALRLIRDHFRGPLTVGQVAERLEVSRSTLVRRFAATLGHGLHDELVAARVREAKRLLAGSDLGLDAVAVRSGFGYPQQMNRVFRSRLGVSPAAYRAAHRHR
jgi:LacI family transcriptional regulator